MWDMIVNGVSGLVNWYNQTISGQAKAEGEKEAYEKMLNELMKEKKTAGSEDNTWIYIVLGIGAVLLIFLFMKR